MMKQRSNNVVCLPQLHGGGGWRPNSDGAQPVSLIAWEHFGCKGRKTLSQKRSRNARAAIVAALALGGFFLFGQGAWIHAKALLAQHLLERAFADSLASGSPIKPWSWADTWPVARIEVSRLGKSSIALEGGTGEAMAFGPGHVVGTPQAGDFGTAVYAAHRDTHFAYLGELVIGDEIKVTRSDRTEAFFRVTATSVVRWDQSGIDALAPGRHLALATCWPLDARLSGPFRYVVHAEMVSSSLNAKSVHGTHQ